MSQLDISNQIKEGFEKHENIMSEFKKDVDTRIKQLETKGKVDPLLETKIQNMDKTIETLVDKLDKTNVALQRAAQAKEDQGLGEKEVQKKMRTISNQFLRNGWQAVKEEDRKFYNERIPAEERAAEYKTASLSRGSDIDGGYLVRPEFSLELNAKVFESSPIRREASVMSIGSDAYEEPYDYDEATVGRGGEQTSYSQTATPQLSMARWTAYEMRAAPYASQQILEDAGIDIEAWLMRKVADKFARYEANDFCVGDGSNKSKGFMAYSNGTSFNTVEQVTSGESASFAAVDFIQVQDTLFDVFQQNAKWFMQRATRSYCRQLVDGQGRFLLANEGNLQDGFNQVILGKPVVACADIAARGSAALCVAYGDMKQGYLIVDRIGISVLRDPYTVAPNVKFLTRKRVGGGVYNFQALKILKCGA